MTRRDIFVVEDDKLLAWALSIQIEELGYTVAGMAATAPEAVAAVLRLRPAAVLMDIRLAGGTSGLDAARQIRAASRVPILFCSAYADVPGVADHAEAISDSRLVGKPVTDHQLRQLLDEMLCGVSEPRAPSSSAAATSRATP